VINPNKAFKDKHNKPVNKYAMIFSESKAANFRCGECNLDFKMVVHAHVEFYPNAVKCPLCDGTVSKWFIPSTTS
jgi:hypothetical protein